MTHPSPSTRPIFYDEDRRRWTWLLRLGAAALFIASILFGVFVVSVLALPLLPHNALPRSHALDTSLNPILTNRAQAKRRFDARSKRSALARLEEAERIAADERRRQRREAAERRRQAAPPGRRIHPPIVAAFYVNWEQTSLGSLHKHVDQLTHFLPEWLHLTRDGRSFTDARIPEDRIDVEPFVRAHAVPILPILNNYISDPNDADKGAWDPVAAHRLLADPSSRARFVGNLRDYILAQKWQGVNLDLETLDAGDRDLLTEFVRELAAAFHRAGLLVTQDIQPEDDAFDVAALAEANDFLVPMLYDEHSAGDATGPGSIAGISWTRKMLDRLLQQAPADKLVLGLGNYAYDWRAGHTDAESLTYQAAIVQAKESKDPDNPRIARIEIDRTTLNPMYRYVDDNGADHVVWMLDAATTYNQLRIARPHHPAGVALWYMGAEDPGVWEIIGSEYIGQDRGDRIDEGLLNRLHYGRSSEVDFEGEGELLQIEAQPSDGNRIVRRDPATGFIVSENYLAYPSSWVVRRYGDANKKIVLTFDDGPDPRWTPRILDILRREGVKATFFMVGENIEHYPAIVARLWDEGHEIGNHSYTHANLALTGTRRTLLEIAATQRAIESVTGHTTTLFRPPYAIDVEPRTGSDLRPILLAEKYNFLAVGEKIDPQDWNLTKPGPDGAPVRRTAQDIVDAVWRDRDAGSILLLHDGGGDRSATIEALPVLIRRLKAAGYQFITIAQLRGVPRDALFPPITGAELALVGVDRWVFTMVYTAQLILVTLFGLSVILGVSRQVIFTVLAIVQLRRERRRFPAAEPTFRPAVSVVIAAYNEATVIERTVRAILASDYPDVQVIVVDDGSTDDTDQVVRTAFGSEPRVLALRKQNGGKASALNFGLTAATGEIVVALDADTLFAPDTISRLVRHFADPRIGAVSGNVRVGNPRNVLTKWQALEYITSQNFDRRAYDLLNCITVVPGAVGAWRRSAIEAVGGYSSDTLAEDTDLTWRVRRAGYRISNDGSALAFTEAPETLPDLARQRFRWAFGTLQCLWKHRSATFRHGAFGWVALPSLWLYQILFPAISPAMDVAMIWAVFAGNLGRLAGYYLLMVGFELLGAALAVRMDRANPRLLPWLLLQRLVYRQLMYYVILKSIVVAIRGHHVGWGKLDRRGTAEVGT